MHATMRTRALLTALFVVLAALAAASGADGKTRRKPSCNVKGAQLIAKNKRVVVLSRTEELDDLNTEQVIYGCVRSRKHPFAVAFVDSNQYGSGGFAPVELNGAFLAVVENSNTL